MALLCTQSLKQKFWKLFSIFLFFLLPHSPSPSPIKYLSNHPLLPTCCYHAGLCHCNLLPCPLQLCPSLVSTPPSAPVTAARVMCMKHESATCPSKDFLTFHCLPNILQDKPQMSSHDYEVLHGLVPASQFNLISFVLSLSQGLQPPCLPLVSRRLWADKRRKHINTNAHTCPDWYSQGPETFQEKGGHRG